MGTDIHEPISGCISAIQGQAARFYMYFPNLSMSTVLKVLLILGKALQLAAEL